MLHSFLLAKLLGVNQALAQGIKLENPLGSDATIQTVLENVLQGLLVLATPIFLIMVFASAYYFLASGGNEDRIKTGKRILLYAIIGYGIILWGRGIMFIIAEVLGA